MSVSETLVRLGSLLCHSECRTTGRPMDDWIHSSPDSMSPSLLSHPPGTKAPVRKELPAAAEDHVGGYHLAVSTFAGVERKFGLHLPKFRPSAQPTQPAGSTAEAAA